MKQIITLPCFGIKITPPSTITSDLHEDFETPETKVAIDTLESFILACASAGVDVEGPDFLEAIETTVDAIGNNVW